MPQPPHPQPRPRPTAQQFQGVKRFFTDPPAPASRPAFIPRERDERDHAHQHQQQKIPRDRVTPRHQRSVGQRPGRLIVRLNRDDPQLRTSRSKGRRLALATGRWSCPAASRPDNTSMSTLVSTLRTGVRGMMGLSRSALDLEPVTDEVLRDRRRICAACPAATRTKRLGVPAAGSLRVLTPLSTCTACKCNLHAKTRLASEACPRRLWGRGLGSKPLS